MAERKALTEIKAKLDALEKLLVDHPELDTASTLKTVKRIREYEDALAYLEGLDHKLVERAKYPAQIYETITSADGVLLKTVSVPREPPYTSTGSVDLNENPFD